MSISIEPTVVEIANDICMTGSAHPGSILLVEGSSDGKFFKKFVDSKSCVVIPTNGKEYGISVLDILRKRRFRRALLIVDADFDNLDGVKYESKNIVLTETHDIETLILQSNALENVLNEYSNYKKLEEYQKRWKKGLKEKVLDISIEIGYVRWASLKFSWNLDFKELDYEQFIDKNNLDFSLKKFYKYIIDKNNRKRITMEDLTEGTKKLKLKSKDEKDRWNICCGHDITEILLLGFTYIFGRYVWDFNRQRIESLLRLTYEEGWLKDTELYEATI